MPFGSKAYYNTIGTENLWSWHSRAYTGQGNKREARDNPDMRHQQDARNIWCWEDVLLVDWCGNWISACKHMKAHLYLTLLKENKRMEHWLKPSNGKTLRRKQVKLPITCRGNDLISEVHTQITGCKSPNGQAEPRESWRVMWECSRRNEVVQWGDGPPWLEAAALCSRVEIYNPEKKLCPLWIV